MYANVYICTQPALKYVDCNVNLLTVCTQHTAHSPIILISFSCDFWAVLVNGTDLILRWIIFDSNNDEMTEVWAYSFCMFHNHTCPHPIDGTGKCICDKFHFPSNRMATDCVSVRSMDCVHLHCSFSIAYYSIRVCRFGIIWCWIVDILFRVPLIIVSP